MGSLAQEKLTFGDLYTIFVQKLIYRAVQFFEINGHRTSVCFQFNDMHIKRKNLNIISNRQIIWVQWHKKNSLLLIFIPFLCQNWFTGLFRLLKKMVTGLLFVSNLMICIGREKITTIYLIGILFVFTVTRKTHFWGFLYRLCAKIDVPNCRDFWNKWSWGFCLLPI